MNIHDYAESKRLSLKQILDFTSGVNPLGPSNKAKNAIRKAIKYLEFPPDENIRHLKRYICKQGQIEENCIIFGQGSSPILHSLLRAIRPKTILLVSPVSKRYKETIEHHGIKIRLFPVDERNGFPINIEELVKDFETADMLILPNPHDMTGAVMPAEGLSRLVEAAEGTGRILVIDESYMDFISYKSPVTFVAESQNALILRTFSLFYALPGLPLGYGIGSHELIDRISDNLIPARINALASTAAMASLKDKGYRARTLKFIQDEKGYFTDKLKQVDGVKVFDTACNFLLLEIERQVPDLAALFLKRHIMIEAYSSESGGICLKAPVKRHKSNAKFIKTLKYIIKA